MSVEPSAFLLKEQELMKLNEEINSKTKSLLDRTSKQTQTAAKNRFKDGKAKVDRKATPADAYVQIKAEPVRQAPTPTSSEESSAKPSPTKGSQSKSAAAIPPTLEKRNLSSEGLIKFLKSKVTILQDEIDIGQKESLKKVEEVQSLSQKLAKLEQQRDQLNTKNNSLQANLKLSEEKIIELELKVKERDNDTVRLGKEGEVSRRDMKTLQQMNTTFEKRLLAAQQEIEALKINLAAAYDREREARDQARAERDTSERQIRQLRKQRISLITAYKQQLLLLDNLKRQNLCLEEAKMLEFSEKEFTKILNWEK